MEQIFNDKLGSLGFTHFVTDIFSDWENVKDEILHPQRKKGSGNGTIHVFLGAGELALRAEFSDYFNAVENGEAPDKGAVKIKHFFSKSNLISMIGHLCDYEYLTSERIKEDIPTLLKVIHEEEEVNGLLYTSSFFKLSLGANKLRPYFKLFDSEGLFHKVIRRLLLPNSSYKIALYKNDHNEYAAFWLIGFNEDTSFEAHTISEPTRFKEKSLQVIYYGAPGTGKSYKIKNLEKGKGTKPVRTTFHPDSDYATFVGAYKPTMIDNNDGRPNRSYSIDELAELLKVAYQSSERKTLGVDSFVLTYAEQINGIYGKISIKDLVEKSGLPDGYQATINDALNLYHYYIKLQSKDTKIAYKYIPQAFLKAYTQAWKHYPKPQYLVIEEINRGNCAQIFGDLFQLLDRSATGFSEYPIAADSDISKYLSETFATDDEFAPDESARAEINELYKEEYTDVMADVRSGELLLLPKNLHILATMNTSDQSLFPIDSAFKRRWDWEYIPIRNANKDWVITASGKEWDWWTFLQCINEKIGSVTDSEDKKLGYFFVKPHDNHTISAETFVSKVVFYLWNDVFKDYGFNDKEFQTANGAEMTFPMFYETNVEGQQVNEELVAQFLQNMVGEPLQDNSNEPATEETTGA